MLAIALSSELERIHFADGPAFAVWLEKNHAASSGIWIKFAKKNSGVASLYYPEALELALCYGWIDGQVKSLDEHFYLQRFTPRRPRSIWSKINRSKAERLLAEGRMQPAGVAEVERARADGRWERAYDSPASASPPDDLISALGKNEPASRFFETLNSANRYAIIWRLQTAKKPETRRARLEKILGMLERGEKFH
ncbi:MAG: YdeI/OmpD-associated family protein [Vulcanimicrobiota bacterium]